MADVASATNVLCIRNSKCAVSGIYINRNNENRMQK